MGRVFPVPCTIHTVYRTTDHTVYRVPCTVPCVAMWDCCRVTHPVVGDGWVELVALAHLPPDPFVLLHKTLHRLAIASHVQFGPQI